MNPIKTSPKDFFLHLAAAIVLYTSAIALINLVMSIINFAFPDPLAGSFYTGSMAWPISMLIILIPVLYVLEWLIKKDITITPEKDFLWVRRWRTYLTLFLAGATIIGDLITLINTYIKGEISQRFIWKFLAVLVIFAVIFAYYILERTVHTPKTKKMQTALSWIGILMVIAAVVGGFVIIGSPGKQRALGLDNQRSDNLSAIQWQVVNFWQSKTRLPASLEELRDPISGMNIPVDPESKKEYEYSVKGNMAFELCATFSLPSQDNQGKGAYYSGPVAYPTYYDASYPGQQNENWKHEAGHVCFDRTIDPELYPPMVKPDRPI